MIGWEGIVNKKVIYLVEDNIEISDLVEYLLNDIGYKTICSTTVSDFNRNIDIALPDMIILDIMLPDGNGIDVCKGLKTNSITNHIPIIIMSAHVNIELKALESGANDFISKPFDIDDFIARVELQSAEV